MYAPKFRSWLTDEERFREALAVKIDGMVDAAQAEIKEDFAKAREEILPPEKKPRSAAEVQQLLWEMDFYRRYPGATYEQYLKIYQPWFYLTHDNITDSRIPT